MSVEDLINHITDENFSKAEITLNDLLADRMNDAIEQEKIAVANQIYNGVNPEDQLELDLDGDDNLDDEQDDLDDDNDE